MCYLYIIGFIITFSNMNIIHFDCVHPHWSFFSLPPLPNQSPLVIMSVFFQWDWGYLQEHGLDFVYRSLGTLPAATPLKKMSLPLYHQPLATHKSSWAPPPSIMRVLVRPILFRYCVGNYSYSKFRTVTAMPGMELSVSYCSPIFLWLLHPFQITRFEWDVNKGIGSVGEDGKVRDGAATRNYLHDLI